MPTHPPQRGQLDEYIIYLQKTVEVGDFGGLAPRSQSKISTINQRSCDGCFWKDGRSVYYFKVAACSNSDMPTHPPQRGQLDEYIIYLQKTVEVGLVG
jgi:hypothetical protein